jgi:hypothetical protein
MTDLIMVPANTRVRCVVVAPEALPLDAVLSQFNSVYFSLVFTVPSIEVRSPTGAENFSFSPCVQSGSGAHPACYPVGTGGSFPGGKARPGHDADHSPPSSAEVKNE